MTTQRLTRSLTDRVLGGVCGGLGAYLGLNPWYGRAAFVVLTVLSGGVAALLYFILWTLLPPNLEVMDGYSGRDLGMLLLVGAAVIVTGLVILARGLGLLSGPGGTDLFWPLVLLIVGVVWLWRQISR